MIKYFVYLLDQECNKHTLSDVIHTLLYVSQGGGHESLKDLFFSGVVLQLVVVCSEIVVSKLLIFVVKIFVVAIFVVVKVVFVSDVIADDIVIAELYGCRSIKFYL